MSTRLDRLEQHRTWLWVVIGLVVAALGGGFLFLLGQIDSRFDRVDGKAGELAKLVGDLRVEIVAQRADIKSALEPVNDEPQGSPRKR